MIDITDRVLNEDLKSKIVSAEEVANWIQPNMTLACSGFTASGYPKAIPLALAERMRKEPFTVNIWTGASTGPELDGALAEVKGIKQRLPYQTDAKLRPEINDGTVNYLDLHLSESAQLGRYGYLGKIDAAIVEVCAITEEGNLIPTTSLGNAASYVQSADVVIVEVNTTQPLALEGIHDVYVPLDPPNRLPIPLVKADDRIGTTYKITPATFRRLTRTQRRWRRSRLNFCTKKLRRDACRKIFCLCNRALATSLMQCLLASSNLT